MSFPEILTLADVAELFDLPSESAALKFIEENDLPRVQLGEVTVVLQASLLAWLREREVPRPGQKTHRWVP